MQVTWWPSSQYPGCCSPVEPRSPTSEGRSRRCSRVTTHCSVDSQATRSTGRGRSPGCSAGSTSSFPRGHPEARDCRERRRSATSSSTFGSGSPMAGQLFEIELSPGVGGLLIPAGCAHAYEALEDDTIVCYAQDVPFGDPASYAGIRADSAGIVASGTAADRHAQRPRVPDSAGVRFPLRVRLGRQRLSVAPVFLRPGRLDASAPARCCGRESMRPWLWGDAAPRMPSDVVGEPRDHVSVVLSGHLRCRWFDLNPYWCR